MVIHNKAFFHHKFIYGAKVKSANKVKYSITSSWFVHHFSSFVQRVAKRPHLPNISLTNAYYNDSTCSTDVVINADELCYTHILQRRPLQCAIMQARLSWSVNDSHNHNFMKSGTLAEHRSTRDCTMQLKQRTYKQSQGNKPVISKYTYRNVLFSSSRYAVYKSNTT